MKLLLVVLLLTDIGLFLLYLLWKDKYYKATEDLSTANKLIYIYESRIESQKSYIEELEEYGAHLEDSLNPKTKFGVGDVVEFVQGAEIMDHKRPALVSGVFLRVYAADTVTSKVMYALYQHGLNEGHTNGYNDLVEEEQIRKA